MRGRSDHRCLEMCLPRNADLAADLSGPLAQRRGRLGKLDRVRHRLAQLGLLRSLARELTLDLLDVVLSHSDPLAVSARSEGPASLLQIARCDLTALLRLLDRVELAQRHRLQARLDLLELLEEPRT